MPEDDLFQGRALAKAKASRLGRAPPAQAQAPAPAPAPARAPSIVDVGAKPHVAREAVAEGFLRLRKETLVALAEGRGPKGDPLPAAQVAGVMAAKRTPDLIPFCHPIPLTAVEVTLTREGEGVRCRALVRSVGQTGVEMEALTAVAGALLTVWDMTKALEKDATGNYPATALESIRVVSKTKG